MANKKGKAISFVPVYTRRSLLEIINGLPIAVAVIDANRKVALLNEQAARFVNKKERQLIGHVGGEALGCQNHDDVPEGCGFGPECMKCTLRKTIQKTMENKASHMLVETSLAFKGHGKKYLRISTQPLILNDENVVLLSIEDITRARKHELTKLEKEKLSAAIKTAGAVCHEMNQPMMTLLGYTELVLDELKESSPHHAELIEIKKQVERLGEITHKLMNIAEYKTKKYLKSEILDVDAAASAANPSEDNEKEPL